MRQEDLVDEYAVPVASLGIFGLIELMIATFLARSQIDMYFAIIALLRLVSFLLVSYVVYAFIYTDNGSRPTSS